MRLDNVVIPIARKLRFTRDIEQLVTAVNGEVIYGVIRRDGGPVVVLAVNIDEGDLALRTAFPIMVTNAVGQLTGRDDAPRMSLSTGEVAAFSSSAIQADLDLAASPASWQLVGPEGAASRLVSDQTEWTVGPFDRAGLWQIEPTGSTPADAPNATTATAEKPAETTRLADVRGFAIACNLSSRAETDLRPPVDLLTQNHDETVLAALGGGPPWYYLAALAVGLLVVEWGLYQRRWIT